MPKLNQINALVTARRGDAEKAISDLGKVAQKEALFAGRERAYRPLDEVNGQKLPPESQKVQQRAQALLETASARWAELWNLVAAQDLGNQAARADVAVDGAVLLAGVPVTTLLFLDKQLAEVEKLVRLLPTPDPAEEWSHDPNSGLLRGQATESVRTGKEPAVFVKYEATKEHPAQTEFYMRDVAVGVWRQIQYSGCIQADRKEAILGRVKKLQDAVKTAREQANLQEVERQKLAEPLLAFLFSA